MIIIEHKPLFHSYVIQWMYTEALISETKPSIHRVTVRAERLMSAIRPLFSGHTISITVNRQAFINSPSVNGLILFPISSSTAKLARVLLSDSVLCLMKVPCCSVNDLPRDSILFLPCITRKTIEFLRMFRQVVSF